MSEHTKTPWYASDILDNDCYGIVSADEKIIIGTSGNVKRKEDIQFIVRAVNSHDALLLAAKDAALMIADIYKEALYGDMKKFRDSPTVDRLLKAISQAEKKP